MRKNLNNKFYDAQKQGGEQVKSALPDQSTGALVTFQRESKFKNENEAIAKLIGSNKFVWQVMTPFELDMLVNPEDPSKKKKATTSADQLK